MCRIDSLLAYEEYLPVLTPSEVDGLLASRPSLDQLQDWSQRLDNHRARLESVLVVPIKNRKIMEDKNLMSADVDIVVRFFSAIDRLKADGCIGGLKTITDRYGLNRWNIMSLREKPAEYYGRFRPSWVQFLVRDYHINPYWLLLGSGEFYATGFTPEIVKNLNKNCTRKKQSA